MYQRVTLSVTLLDSGPGETRGSACAMGWSRWLWYKWLSGDTARGSCHSRWPLELPQQAASQAPPGTRSTSCGCCSHPADPCGGSSRAPVGAMLRPLSRAEAGALHTEESPSLRPTRTPALITGGKWRTRSGSGLGAPFPVRRSSCAQDTGLGFGFNSALTHVSTTGCQWMSLQKCFHE